MTSSLRWRKGGREEKGRGKGSVEAWGCPMMGRWQELKPVRAPAEGGGGRGENSARGPKWHGGGVRRVRAPR